MKNNTLVAIAVGILVWLGFSGKLKTTALPAPQSPSQGVVTTPGGTIIGAKFRVGDRIKYSSSILEIVEVAPPPPAVGSNTNWPNGFYLLKTITSASGYGIGSVSISDMKTVDDLYTLATF